jgi:hypothetical protein
MTDLDLQLPNSELEEDATTIVPILFIPPRMLTRTRLDPLLAIAGEVNMRVVVDEDRDELSIGIGISHDVFEAATDSELAEVVHLFHGLEEAAYHPRLLAILKRSLN